MFICKNVVLINLWDLQTPSSVDLGTPSTSETGVTKSFLDWQQPFFDHPSASSKHDSPPLRAWMGGQGFGTSPTATAPHSSAAWAQVPPHRDMRIHHLVPMTRGDPDAHRYYKAKGGSQGASSSSTKLFSLRAERFDPCPVLPSSWMCFIHVPAVSSATRAQVRTKKDPAADDNSFPHRY